MEQELKRYKKVPEYLITSFPTCLTYLNQQKNKEDEYDRLNMYHN